MTVKIVPDAAAPTAAVELMIRQPLPDYDLEKIEAPVPRDVDPMLASQGFKDLLDEARGILDRLLAGSRLEIAQLTGAICNNGGVYRPGIWLVLRETGVAAADQPMSAAAQAQVTVVAEELRRKLALS